MKALLTALSVLFAQNAMAGICENPNTMVRLALENVKSMIALAEVPAVIEYHGGIAERSSLVTVVNIQPRYQYTKDWYKVSIRNSDCRIVNVNLFIEKMPVE